MSDAIVFPCPACGTKYNVGPQHAGKKTNCKKCGAQITVPSPEIANPTMVGGTRTIGRNDMEAALAPAPARHDSGATTKMAKAVRGRQTTEEVPAVDMKGGASVLRRDAMIKATPAPTRKGQSSRRHPVAHPPSLAQAAGYSTPQYGPQGQMYGPPRKKSPVPLVLGIGGGVIALVLVVVLVVVGTSNTGAGTRIVANQPSAPVVPQRSVDDLLLEEMQKHLDNAGNVASSEAIQPWYDRARENREKEGFKPLMDGFARELAAKATAERAERMARVGLQLDKDGYPDGRVLLEKSLNALPAAREISSRTADGTPVRRQEPEPLYVEVATRLGHLPYVRPDRIDEYSALGIPEVREYDLRLSAPDLMRYQQAKLYPPDILEEIKGLEQRALAAGKALFDQHEADGFALNARRAFLRFLNANAGGRVNRKKNQRAWSPEAMERKDETVEQIWTYTYWKPFIVYVERPIGVTDLDPEFKETLESKAALLQHIHEYFRTNLVDRYNLQRVKPEGNGGKRPDGTWYDSKAQQADAEGWPMEIVVLRDSEAFEQLVEDVNGQPMPGARAFYSPLNEHVVTFDDREDAKPETAWFNESVLIHETFHLLSDHFAAGPMFTFEQMKERPRYSSILVQEGLTDSVSGFVRGGGEGRAATYEFLQLNHLRLKDWQAVHKMMRNQMLYRFEDMLQCRHYGECMNMALKRFQELGFRVRSQAQANAIGNWGLGVYYASACQASYFLHMYQENGVYVYRDIWWRYIGLDYKGEITKDAYDTKNYSGLEKFKEMFGIETDEDWKALNDKFEKFTLALKPENVGSGGEDLEGPPEAEQGEGEGGSEKEESRRPVYRGFALPAREDSRAA